jgi:hypothetical protein
VALDENADRVLDPGGGLPHEALVVLGHRMGVEVRRTPL